MQKYRIFQKKNLLFLFTMSFVAILALIGRLIYFMVFVKDRYEERARQLHERERSIKAARGIIYDRNHVVLADNRPVCTISVIHNQITDAERVISEVSHYLDLSE